MRSFLPATLAVALLTSITHAQGWQPGEVHRVSEGRSYWVMALRSQAAVERSLSLALAVKNHKERHYPPATDRVDLYVGTRVGLIGRYETKFGDGDITFYQVRVQEGPHKGLVCYTLNEGEPNDLVPGEILQVVDARAFGAFDREMLSDFDRAQEVGDTALCRSYLGLERVIPLRLGTRVSVYEREASSDYIRVYVEAGKNKGKVLYIDRDRLQVPPHKGR